MNLSLYTLGALAPLYSPLWQRWLRYSVRLYLALGEPGVNVRRTEKKLRLAEKHLLKELSKKNRFSATDIRQARAILEHEQATLLSCEADVAGLLAEFPDGAAMPQLLAD